MSVATPRLGAPFVFRVAFRDLRGGLSGFGIFLACIALGVAAIVGVGSVSRGLSDGLAREGRRILGGDAAFSLIHGGVTAAEREWLAARGTLSTIASLRAMARRPDAGDSALVEIKAVDATYPAIGDVVLAPENPVSDVLGFAEGAYGIAADSTLAGRLDLKVGDRLAIGDLTVELRAILVSEPDRLGVGIGFGPRVIMSQAALNASGLLQPGSLVRWTTRIALGGSADGHPVDDAAVARFTEAADHAFPDAGWQVRTRTNVSPQFAKNLDHFTQFLTLVGLTALVVGGVGVANAVRAYVERKRPDLATLKSLGATGGTVFAVTLTEVLVAALVGIALGLIIGAALPFAIAFFFGSLIPFPFVPAFYPSQLSAGLLYGLLTALAFSLLPLGRAHDVPVSALFRDQIEPGRALPRRRYLVMVGAAIVALVGAILLFATDRRLAGLYIGATVAAFIVLRAVGFGIMVLARRLPRPRRTEWRLALGNIHRPGALTPSVVLSLGLGLTLLVALTLIDGNIRSEIETTLPGQTPSFFFLDVQSADMPAFDDFLKKNAPDATIERVPMMRGRVVRLNGVRAEDVHPGEDAAWVLDGDRGITFADAVPPGSTLTDGAWWPANYDGPPLVSLDAGIARGLGLKRGNSITVNVLGRNITATIANLRSVNWRSLGINFVFVFSPNAFAGAPYSMLATAAYPNGGDAPHELALLKAAAAAFPAVTTVRVKDALDALNGVMNQLAFAVRGASAVALGAAILVLAGAVAAGQRARVYDAVVLKTLGATRWRLIAALVIEYAGLGLATALFGVVAGAVAAYGVVVKVMKLDGFVWLWSSAIGAALVALVLTIGLGLLGTWRVLGQKPAPYLRNL